VRVGRSLGRRRGSKVARRAILRGAEGLEAAGVGLSRGLDVSDHGVEEGLSGAGSELSIFMVSLVQTMWPGLGREGHGSLGSPRTRRGLSAER